MIETSHDPRKVDHLWIDVRAGESGIIRVSLNTRSLKNRDAGFDPRVRLAVVAGTWSELPPAGMQAAQPLDYRRFEAAYEVRYLEHEQHLLETLLLAKAQGALALEAWGEFYMQHAPGIHQVHSRRGSLAMPKDFVGHDGAAKFYFAEEYRSELLLFKFAGQPWSRSYFCFSSGGLTATSSPSRKSSVGFTTAALFSVSPSRISRLVPKSRPIRIGCQ